MEIGTDISSNKIRTKLFPTHNKTRLRSDFDNEHCKVRKWRRRTRRESAKLKKKNTLVHSYRCFKLVQISIIQYQFSY